MMYQRNDIDWELSELEKQYNKFQVEYWKWHISKI